VHVFEEDTQAGAVYRPEESDIPLSRRPRTVIELDRGGLARVYTGGPDDRRIASSARWRVSGGAIAIDRPGAAPLRVSSWAEDRLLVE
jgi:hypothetical protein